MQSFLMMLKDDAGNTAAEYALIIALVGTAVALAAINLGNTIATTINGTSNLISRCTSDLC